VEFFDNAGETAGGVLIRFSSKVEYRLGWCDLSTTFHDITSILTSTSDKVWKITLTRTSDARLQIRCNDVVVADVRLSDSACDFKYWKGYWKRTVEKIQFSSKEITDTASDDYYRSSTVNS
jgi:hypothetical protein